jgi:hypothetical protein
MNGIPNFKATALPTAVLPAPIIPMNAIVFFICLVIYPLSRNWVQISMTVCYWINLTKVTVPNSIPSEL